MTSFQEILNYLDQEKIIRDNNENKNEAKPEKQEKKKEDLKKYEPKKQEEIIKKAFFSFEEGKKEKKLPDIDEKVKLAEAIETPLFSENGFDISKFEDLMRNELIKSDRIRDSYVKTHLSVGDLLRCFRQVYYERMKYSYDARNKYNFSYLYLIQEVGTFIHDKIEKLYHFSEVEKKIKSEKYNIKGRIDAVLGNYIIDFKTCEEIPNEYKKTDFLQGLIYSYILNNEYKNYKIETVQIVYIERSLKKIKTFDISLKEEHFKKCKTLLDNSVKLLDCINKKTLPDKFNSTEETCKYCPYKKVCIEHTNENKNVDAFSL